jgi:hypothetical protein
MRACLCRVVIESVAADVRDDPDDHKPDCGAGGTGCGFGEIKMVAFALSSTMLNPGGQVMERI